MQPKHRKLEDRPKRPKYYLPMHKRTKNILWSQDRFERIVKESEEYDKYLAEVEEAAKSLRMSAVKPPRTIDVIHYSSLANLIISEYEKIYDVKWDKTNNSFLKLLIDYSFSARVFGKEESNFIHSPLLEHKVGSRVCNPSLKKGLLVIGDYGVGKTSLMKTFDYVIRNSHNLKVRDVSRSENYLIDYAGNYKFFNVHSAKEITDLYQSDKKEYKIIEQSKILTLDELMRENKVFGNDNTGKELMPEFINERYNNRLITHAIVNYPSNNKTVSGFCEAYAARYGGHIFDRLFEMFNIVEVSGNSKRH